MEFTDVFDLTTPEGVKKYLLQTPFPATDVTQLVGGLGNFTYRVKLVKPFSHALAPQTPISQVVLKHAEPYSASNRDFPLDVGRQEFEILSCREIPKIISTSNVSLPTVYYEDTSNNVILFHDCGETSMTLKEYLKQRPPPIELAGQIGSSLGKFIGTLHLLSHQSQSPDSPGVLLKERFSRNVQGRHISAYITYGVVKNLVSSLNTMTSSQLDKILAFVDSAEDRIKNTNEVLVMGDFWPGNILVHGDFMDQLTIVDWELAKPGLAGLDVGQFLAELYTTSKFYPSSRSAVEQLVLEFVKSYKSVVSSHPSFDLSEVEKIATAHVGVHLIAITPIARPKWGSDEMIDEIISEGYTFILNADADEWRRECLFGAFS